MTRRRRVMAKARLSTPNGHPIPPGIADHLLTLDEVVAITHLSERGLRKFVSLEMFPPPIKVGRRSLWSHVDIQTWIKQKRDERPMRRASGER